MSEITLAEARQAYQAKRTEFGDAPTAEQLAELTALAEQIQALASTENTEAETAEVEAETEESVAASAAEPVAEPTRTAAPFVAAADVAGYASGSDMTFRQVAEAVVRKASTFKGPARARQEFSIAQISKPTNPNTVIRSDDPAEVRAAIDFAKDERNTPAGSLVASGGWCTPSETWYDLLNLSSSDGLLSIPAVTLNRGGVRLIPGGGPQFAEVYADTGFCFTEAEDIAGSYGDGTPPVPKNCYKVECPEWEDFRLDVCGVCITAGILQNRAFPELTQDLIEKALIAHRHRLDSNIIAAIVAGSTAVVGVDSTPVLTAAAPILNSVELQVLDIRSKYRMSDSFTIEAKFPSWTKGLIRADLAYRTGVDLLSVSDEQINAWFRQRNVSVQYLANLEPLAGLNPAVGYPEDVSYLIYPAGTWVKGEADIIDLGVVYSPEQFTFNNYTALFSEEAYNVLPVGPESRIVTLATCPSGATGIANLICPEGS